MKKENAEAKVSAIDLVKELSLLKDEMSKMKRQLRQRKALFNIFLTKMGGITFEFEIASDTAYFTEMGEDGTPKETVINNFRKWIYSHAENGVEFLLRLQRFVDTKGASVEEKNYGTLEWPAKINTEEFHWCKLDYQVVFDDNENVIAMIGYMQDIHEEYSKRLDLEQQAQRDSMTKLYNRATTERLINEQLATIKEREKGVLFLLDVDNFKQLNDNLGHLAGDKYLKGVSEAVSNAFRSSDVVGRIGGDEFVVFARDEDMESIRDKLEEAGDYLAERGYHVSIGLCRQERPIDMDTLVKQAEAHMYTEKDCYYQKTGALRRS